MYPAISWRPVLAACLFNGIVLAAAVAAPAAPPAPPPGPARAPSATGADPALLAQIREVLEGNPGIAAARAAVEAAAARQRAADRPLYNPEVSLEAENGETSTLSLGLDQTIDWTGKRGDRGERAGRELDALRAELEARRQSVAHELLTALGRYQAARSLQDLAQRRDRLMQRFLELAEKRRRTGDLGQVELDLARLAAVQARLQYAQAAAETARAAHDLASVAGTDGRDWPALPEDLPVPEAWDADAILAELPAVRAQQARIAAARATVSLRSHQTRPDPTVGIRGGREGEDALIGVSLSMPLYLRNNFQAEVDAANAELIQAEREGQDLYRRARARLESAAERYRLAHAAWDTWRRAGQPSIASQVQVLERIWRAGELSTADYLVQLRQTLDTRADALAVRGRLWTAWFDWLAASGRIDDWVGTAGQ